MRWTAEAIENLIRLALEGRSASFIAAALGAASRNAVIGKANRIGVKLNGDGRASVPGGASARTYRAPLAAVPHKPVPDNPNFASSLARGPQVKPRVKPAVASKVAWTFAEAEVGEMRRMRFEEIRGFACRWPLGDPRSEDFAYCGLKPAEGHSYCAGHCRMAYRQPDAGARQNRHERRWSRALASP